MREKADELVPQVARLVRQRNAVDAQIAAVTHRPAVAGHLGECLAAQLFDIDLEASAAAKAYDGRFTTGPLAGKTVNVKMYGKREGVLDMTTSDSLDFYLVFIGPKSTSSSSADAVRPMRIDACHLFDAHGLLARQRERNARVGVASSVRAAEWDAAEIYPTPRNPLLEVQPEVAELLKLFAN